MRILTRLGIGLAAILALQGCGASNGSGTDTVAVPTTRSVSISEILAVDDKILGASVQIGTSLGTDGKVVPLNLPAITTAQDGKTSRVDLSVPLDARTLYFQTLGGTSAGVSIAATSGFLGVAELPEGGTAHTLPRVNINPFSTLVAHVRSKNPALSLNQIAIEALQPFLTTTQSAALDLNSSDYSGTATPVIETSGNAPLFQLFNEMIKEAANQETGANGVERTLNLLDRMQTEAGTQGAYVTNSVFVSRVSSISSSLASTPASLPAYFSQAMQILATSSTATVRPSTFVTNPAQVVNRFLLDSSLKVGSVTSVLTNISDGSMNITSQSGSALILLTIPDSVIFQRLDATYKPLIESELNVKMDLFDSTGSNLTDTILVTIKPVKIDATSVFTMIIPTGSVITGSRTQANGSQASASSINPSEDRYPSATGTITIPVQQLISQGESSFGQTFPDLNGRIFDLKFTFGSGVRFSKGTDGTSFSAFDLKKGRIQP